MPEPSDQPPAAHGSLAQKIAWVLCDWANSGFGLIIMGPLFSPYFVGSLLPQQASLPVRADGSISTGLAIGSLVLPASAVFAVLTSIVALSVTLTSPPLGALADLRGHTKRLFVSFVIAGSVISMACVFLDAGRWLLGSFIYVASAYCFAISVMFNNAFLPVLAPPEKQGRLSGYGFAAGYVGGAAALLVAYKIVIERLGGSIPIGLAFAGVWWLLFTLPAFFLLQEFRKPAPDAPARRLIRASFHRVFETFRHLRRYRMLFLFLLAFLIYNNGIDTAINISAAFTEDVLNLSASEQITIFLIVQFVAAVGAVINGQLADRVGNKPVIVVNLLVWCVAVVLVGFVNTANAFLWVGVLIGLVIGGSQSSSRALMSKLTPREIHNEAFGFFSLSGKAVSVFGPLFYAAAATGLGPRWGVAAVAPFFVVGLIVLLFVREPRAEAEPQSTQRSL